MSVTTKTIGFVIKQRGEYVSNPETRYYKDNVVQYHDSSYIANPIDYDAEENPLAYVTSAPVNNEGVLNEGWKIFASGNNTFSTGEKVTEIGIDDKPTVDSNSLVRSGGVQNELALGAVYDVSAKNPTAGPNNDGKWESLSALLSDASLNTLIPTAYRKGGMSVKFVQSSDNKYVQYRLMADSWSIDTNDWSFCGNDILVENPEFVRVYTDAKDKILWAIKTDGSIYYGAGVPQQVIDYIEEKIADLSLDEYEDIVAFLNGLEESENTLQQLLDLKANKNNAELTGKVSLDKEVDAETDEVSETSVQHIENSEFVAVWLDKNERILFGVQADGNFLFGCGVPKQIVEYINGKITELNLTSVPDIAAFIGSLIEDDTLDNLLNGKVDKVEGKSLIDSEFAASQFVVENPEWADVKTDSENKILEGIKQDGTKVIGGDCQIEGNATILGKVDIQGATYTLQENPEWIKVLVDNQGKIIAGVRKDGSVYINKIEGVTDFLKDLQEQINTITGKDITPDAIDTLTDVYYYLSKLPNTFEGKSVSIIGDSISTFAGYIPEGYATWYPHEDDRSSDVISVEDTWWKQVIDQSGGRLEINASYSGSTASSLSVGFSPRVSVIGNPDVIFIALGTNDSVRGVEIGDIDFNASTYDLSKFAPAYIKGIKDCIEAYPFAKIVCVAFDMENAYRDSIKQIAEHYNCAYIYVGDISNVHPNKSEMAAVANRVIKFATYTLFDELQSLNRKVDYIMSHLTE